MPPITDKSRARTIDRDTILAAALSVLDEVGIDQLTTRRIATRLGVQQPALYWHFKSKRELLDALNEHILQRGHRHRTPGPGETWQAFARSSTRSFRKALLAHRDGARVHAGTRPIGADIAALEAQLAVFIGAGFHPDTAREACIALRRYVVGSVLEEQAAMNEPRESQEPSTFHEFPLLQQVRSSGLFSTPGVIDERAFDAGLEFFVAGLEARRDGDSWNNV